MDNKDIQFNEGMTLTQDGKGDYEFVLDTFNWDKMKHGETFSFVKITNMFYDTLSYRQHHVLFV